MRLLYSLLTYPAAAVAFAAVLWRGRVDRGYWNGLGERFGFGAALGGGPSIWLHAVSLGEVAAAAVVVRALRARHPRTPFVLTTATPTGRARAQALFGDAVDVRRSRSDPTASMRCQRSSTLREMVTSLTGNVSSPFSIQKPLAPREKSPVTALNPKPIMSVT